MTSSQTASWRPEWAQFTVRTDRFSHCCKHLSSGVLHLQESRVLLVIQGLKESKASPAFQEQKALQVPFLYFVSFLFPREVRFLPSWDSGYLCVWAMTALYKVSFSDRNAQKGGQVFTPNSKICQRGHPKVIILMTVWTCSVFTVNLASLHN